MQSANPRATRALLGCLVAAQLVVAAAVHTAAVLTGLLVAMLVEATLMTLLLQSLRRDNAKRLAAAPPGTLFVGQGEVRLASLRDQPRFAPMAQGRRGFAVVGIITVDRAGIRFRPRRSKSGSPADADISWDEALTLRAISVQGKINVGRVDVEAQDGTHLCFQAASYSRLAAALNCAPGRPTPNAAVVAPGAVPSP